MISTEQLSDVFIELAGSLIDNYNVVDFLQNVTDHAAAVSGASSVGLLLADHHGTLQFMAASNQSGKALELYQLQHAEGPCLDCFATKAPVVNAHLDQAADRWPHFAPRAIQAGFQSVHAFPMRLRDQVIGALNLFGSSKDLFAPGEIRLVQALADVAAIAILQERSITNADLLTTQLQGALNSRITIEQAKGALAQLEGISTSEAFEVLRQRAQSTQRHLVDVATDLLDNL